MPEFVQYVASYDGGCGIVDTYGEPFSSPKYGFFHDSSSLPYKVEEADSKNSPWNEIGQNEWGYQYDGSGNLGGMFESCFGGFWGDDLFYRSYGTLDTGYGSVLGNTEDPQQGEEWLSSYYSYNNKDDMEMQYAYDNYQWSGNVSEFEFEEEEECYGYGTEKPVSAYSNSSDEERLCESIFGYWPGLLGYDQESYVEKGI